MAVTEDEDVSMAGNVTSVDTFSILRRMEDEAASQMVVVYLYLAVVIALGLPGNLLVSVVYVTKFKVSTTRYFIVTLAILDLLNCTLAIPVEFVDLYRSYTYPSVVLCKVHATVTAFSSIGSALVLLVVAGDRYKKICKPLAPQMRPRQARSACLGCAVAAILAAWPCGLLYGLESVATDVINVTGRRCTDEPYVHTVYPLVYGCLLLLLFAGSITALVTLYSMLCRRIFRQQTLYSLSRKSKAEKKSSSIFYRSAASGETTTETTNSYSLASEDQSEDFSSSDPPCSNTPALNVAMDTSDGNDSAEDSESAVNPQTETKLCTPTRGKPRSVSFQKDLTQNRSHSHELHNAGPTKATPEENGRIRGSGCIGGDESKLDRSLTISDSGIDDSGLELAKDERAPGFPEEETPTELVVTPLRPLISTKRQSRRRVMASRKTTFTLFLVTLIYVLSYLPYLLIGVMHALNKSLFEDMNGTSNVVYALFVRLFYIQSAANPFIYGLRNPHFRAKSLNLLHCRKQK